MYLLYLELNKMFVSISKSQPSWLGNKPLRLPLWSCLQGMKLTKLIPRNIMLLIVFSKSLPWFILSNKVKDNPVFVYTTLLCNFLTATISFTKSSVSSPSMTEVRDIWFHILISDFHFCFSIKAHSSSCSPLSFLCSFLFFFLPFLGFLLLFFLCFSYLLLPLVIFLFHFISFLLLLICH